MRRRELRTATSPDEVFVNGLGRLHTQTSTGVPFTNNRPGS